MKVNDEVHKAQDLLYKAVKAEIEDPDSIGIRKSSGTVITWDISGINIMMERVGVAMREAEKEEAGL